MQAKTWIDQKVYDEADDPCQVFENISVNNYLRPAEYKGSCVLSTLTNSIGCRFVTTMKDLVHLIALTTRESPAKAQLQFRQDLSLKFEFRGGILVKFRNSQFEWYQPKKIDHLDADFISQMIKDNMTLSKIYKELADKANMNNFMQVANHLDDDDLLKFGDVHASNVKLNPTVL